MRNAPSGEANGEVTHGFARSIGVHLLESVHGRDGRCGALHSREGEIPAEYLDSCGPKNGFPRESKPEVDVNSAGSVE